VIDASRDIACIFVDCNWGKKNREISTRFGVTGYPTVVLCDPQGNPLGRLEAREPDEVAQALASLAQRTGAKATAGTPIVVGSGYEVGRVAAKRTGRPLLLYFPDQSPASISINDSLMDRSLVELLPRFSTAKEDFVKGSATCLKFNVSRAPTILVLDCTLANPEEKPLARIEGSRTPRELKRELEAALPARDPAANPAAGGGDLPPVRRETPPEEKLSDDVIERKFIWARVAVAQDTLKRGNKEKAIEILEDVLKSYPKHKDTEDVRKVLEDTRK